MRSKKYYSALFTISIKVFFCFIALSFIAASPYPDRIVLTWAGDPSNSQSVTWRTDRSVQHALAQIAVAEENGHDIRPTEIEATTTPFSSELGGEVYYQSVNFNGLLPGTTYAYRLGDGEVWTEWFHFRTASRNPEPFSFIYFGDAQIDIKTYWSRVFRQAFRQAPFAAFTLHAGDLINRAENDEEWGEWFNAPGWVNASVPVIATPGNHEYSRDPYADPGFPRLSSFWQPQFTFPQNGPEGLKESCYYIDYQGVRFILLNSNEKEEEQGQWLRNVLSHNPQKWTIITFHHPIFSPKAGRDNKELRNFWKPLFDEFKVDLVLTGHDHTYARTHSEGTAYIVSISGPKLYSINKQEWMHRSAEKMQLYQIIRIDSCEFRYEAYTATGKLYDKFTLKKQENEKNLLMEEISDAIISNK